LLQPETLRDHPLLEPLRSERGRRVVGLVVALLIEAILLIVLLTLNIHNEPTAAPGSLTVVDLKAQNEPPDDREQPEQEASDTSQPTEQPAQTQDTPVERPEPVQPDAVAPPPPIAQAVIPTPFKLPSAKEPERPAKSEAPKQVYGPVDTGSQSGIPDSKVVGTAPNGEPLYAARWYREPYDGELSGYLSTANGPGWGLIACKTAPQFRVVDCVPIEESPRGSMINRAILAAAWQFRVRPPMLGGKPQIGSWVRIRIDYRSRL
jgi:periplasmic protein TonB